MSTDQLHGSVSARVFFLLIRVIVELPTTRSAIDVYGVHAAPLRGS